MFQRQNGRLVGLVLRRQTRAQRLAVGGRPVAVHVARQRVPVRVVAGAPVAGRGVQAVVRGGLPPRQPAAPPPPRDGVQELVPELADQPAEPRQIVVVVLVAAAAAQAVVLVVPKHVPLQARRQAQTVADVQVQRQ